MKKELNWKSDIFGSRKRPKTEIITLRINKIYKDFIRKNKLNSSKLLMRACEQLDDSLKKNANEVMGE